MGNRDGSAWPVWAGVPAPSSSRLLWSVLAWEPKDSTNSCPKAGEARFELCLEGDGRGQARKGPECQA